MKEPNQRQTISWYTIPRQSPTLFRDQNLEISQKDQSKEVIKVNCDPFEKLLSLSAKFH